MTCAQRWQCWLQHCLRWHHALVCAQVLWVALNGQRYVWVRVHTQGEAPSPRFHHTCDSFNGAPPALTNSC